MKTLIRLVLFVMVVAAVAFAGEQAVGQVLHIEVDAAGKVAVDGKPASMAALSATVGSSVQDKEHTAVELKIPENLDKATVDQIMNACRRAGILNSLRSGSP